MQTKSRNYFCNIGNVYKLTKRQEEKMFDYKDQNINLCIFQYFVVEIILEKETGKYPQRMYSNARLWNTAVSAHFNPVVKSAI